MSDPEIRDFRGSNIHVDWSDVEGVPERRPEPPTPAPPRLRVVPHEPPSPSQTAQDAPNELIVVSEAATPDSVDVSPPPRKAPDLREQLRLVRLWSKTLRAKVDREPDDDR